MNLKPPRPKKIKLGPIPTAGKYRDWRERLMENVATASLRPTEAFQWIHEVSDAADIHALADSGKGTEGSWEQLDSALLEALQIPKHGEIERQLKLLKKELKDRHGRPLLINGRQVLKVIDEFMKLTDLDTDILEVERLRKVKMINNDLKRYVTEFTQVLGETSAENVPSAPW